MKYDALIVNLRCQYERYRGSGTRMEQMLKDAGAALAKARLTDAEREALIVASIELQSLAMCETSHSDALRKLLARLS